MHLSSDTDLDTLLQASDPARGLEHEPLPAATARSLAVATMDEPDRLPQPAGRSSSASSAARRRRRARLGIGVLAGCLVAPALAAGARYTGIHTGWFPTRHEAGTEAIPGEEVLNLSDPGIVVVVHQEIAKVPLPAGSTWGPVLAGYPMPPDAEGYTTVGQRQVIADRVQGYATCQWERAWVSGDPATSAHAATVIEAMPTWSAYRVSPDLVVAIRAEVAQVRRGDQTLARQDLAVNCGE